MNNLVPQINGLNIRQDAEGRFCLNDLHAAAGGEKRHQPAHFFELDRTKEFVSLLDKESLLPESRELKPVVAKSGRYGGTYVCEELVTLYATWISPEFHLRVIRSFNNTAASRSSRSLATDTFKSLNECLKMNLDSEASDNQKKYLYSNEARMIDKLALGQPSCSYCKEQDIDPVQLRDYLAKNNPQALEKINWLTKQDEALVNLGFEYEERKETLEKLLKTKFVSKLKLLST